MSSRRPSGWAEVATKSDLQLLSTDVRAVESTLRAEIAGVRSDLKIEIAELRSEMREGFAKTVTRDELGELMRLHIDGRLAANTRSTLMWSVAMNATMLGAVIAAIRL